MGEEPPFPTQFPDKKFIVKHPLCVFGNIWSLNGWCFCVFFPLGDIIYITAASLYQLRSAMLSLKKHLIQLIFPPELFFLLLSVGFLLLLHCRTLCQAAVLQVEFQFFLKGHM